MTLRPIGSEKIQEVDERLARIMEIAGIDDKDHEAKPMIGTLGNVIHEAVAADGTEYAIIQENKYVYLKKKNEKGEYEYISGIQNIREHSYPSYSVAFKQLNYLFKQINEDVGQKENIDVLKKKV